MEVLLWEGIGPIKLGMRCSDVLTVFGEEQKYEPWMGGNLNDSLTFHALVLQFDIPGPEMPIPNARLITIRMHGREDARLFGRSLFEVPRQELLDYFVLNGYSVEPQTSGEICIIERNGRQILHTVRLNFEADRLTYLEME